MKHSIVFFLTSWLMASTIVLGQAQTTGRISGRVVDQQGEPVVGARVSVVSSALRGERTTETGVDGEFLAALLPVGPCAVSVAAPGKDTVQVSLRLAVGQTVPLDIVLRDGDAMVERVTVLGAATPLTTTTVGENFSYGHTVEKLPIAERNVNDVALYSPNVHTGAWVPDVLLGASSGAAISGAPAYETVALLDGADITEPGFGGGVLLYLEDAVEEIQVMTTGISARYGRFQGGVVNVTTKTGGNEYSGVVRAEFSKEAWDSRTPFGEEQSRDLNQAYQATVGGYALKDKLWFFAGARRVPTETFSGTTLVTRESYRAENDDRRFQLKLRGAPGTNHVVEAGYLERDFSSTGSSGFVFGDLRAADALRIEEPMSLSTVSYRGILGPNSFLEVLVSRKRHGTSCCGNGSPGTAFIDVGGGDWVRYNNFTGGGKEWRRDNDTASASYTHVFRDSDRGSHTFETGVQFHEAAASYGDELSPTGFNLYAVPLGTTPFAQMDQAAGEVRYNLNNAGDGGDMLFFRDELLDLADAKDGEDYLAVYAEDSWQFGKWRFDAGLRWERFTFDTPRADINGDFDAWSPRLGVTRRIRDNWQAQATWGRYVDLPSDDLLWYLNINEGRTLATRLYTGPALLDLSSDEVETVLADDGQWTSLVNIIDPSQPTHFLADDLGLMTTDELTLGLRGALPRNSGSFTLTYVDRDYKDRLDDFVGDFGAQMVVDPDTGESLIYDNHVWANTSIADRGYRALAATWDYRPAARWDVGGNWTYSELTGNWEAGSLFGSTPIGDYERSRPHAAALPTGSLYDDRAHRLQTWGSYRFDLRRAGGLVLGGVARYQTGGNWSRSADVPLADDPAYNIPPGSTYEHFFDGRGNNHFDDWWALDLSTRWQFSIFKRVNGWLKATLINAFDNDTLIAYDTSGFAMDDGLGNLSWAPVGNCGPGDAPSVSCSGFGRIRSQSDYQRPRSYLFTLGLAF